MYLEPIFTSEDISRQLPLEAKKYGTMERIWRRIMGAAIVCPKVGTNILNSLNHVGVTTRQSMV